MKINEVHALLLAESGKRELPKHYKNDVLVHDLSQLVEDYGEGECGRFMWMLRTCGSHMWTEHDQKIKNFRHDTSIMTVWKQRSDDEWYWYHFDGAELKEVTPEQGCKIPLEAWGKRIHNGYHHS